MECRKCQEEFTPTPNQIKKSDFICLPCCRERTKAWREKRKADGRPVKSTVVSIEWRRKYERERLKNPELKQRKADAQKRYRNDPEKRLHHMARWMVSRALKTRKLKRQPCEVCGMKKSEAHHDDYMKPLEVRWLCKFHHAEHHKLAAKGGAE